MRAFYLVLLALLLAACSGPEADISGNDTPQTPDTPGTPPVLSKFQAPQSDAEDKENALLGSGGVASRMASARPEQPASTCGEGEEVIFACTMKSGKKASICVTEEGDTKFAQYRFGPAGKPAELAWPMSPADGRLAFKSVPYSGGGEGQLSFVKGDTRYVVFSRMVRTNFEPGEPNYPAIEDGILVLRGGSVLGELACADVAMPVQYALAEEYSEPAPEIFYAE